MKMGNFACIEIRIFFRVIRKVIFERYVFSQIFKKRELRKNMYSAKISTFTVEYIGGTFCVTCTFHLHTCTGVMSENIVMCKIAHFCTVSSENNPISACTFPHT